MLDFKALQDMESYSKLHKKPAEAALKSLCKHLWYLNPRFLSALLVDDDLDEEFLEVFAKKLSNTSKSNSYALGRPNNEFKVPDNLIDLISSETWFIFDLMGLKDADLNWLNNHPSQWVSDECYAKFKKFVGNLAVTNDAAERVIKLG